MRMVITATVLLEMVLLIWARQIIRFLNCFILTNNCFTAYESIKKWYYSSFEHLGCIYKILKFGIKN